MQVVTYDMCGVQPRSFLELSKFLMSLDVPQETKDAWAEGL